MNTRVHARVVFRLVLELGTITTTANKVSATASPYSHCSHSLRPCIEMTFASPSELVTAVVGLWQPPPGKL